MDQLRILLVNALVERQGASGGWAYKGSMVAVEPTSLAVLALRTRADIAFDHGVRALKNLRSPDGGWPAFLGDDSSESWPTALALLVLIQIGHIYGLQAAIDYLLEQEGREGNYFWRWKFQTVDNSVKFDPRKYGWSWMPGTTSWVIPTSFSLIALQNVRRAGLRDDRLNDRVNLGISMLLDRICPGGGWNSGNGVAFGMALAPYIDATAIALLALQSHECEAVDASVSWLRGRLRYCRSAYSLAWGVLALAAFASKGSEFGDSLEDASRRLRTAIGKDSSFLDTATVATSALALAALDGDNVFAVRA